MAYDMVKFERGQVWMVRFKHQEAVGHEKNKDRPWLILSIGNYNHSSGMLTAVPITTRDEIRGPYQVKFINWYGRTNIICCENIRSFDYSAPNYMFEYMGKVSDEILEKVDVSISMHLGLHYSPITLKKLHNSMEAIIKSVGYMEHKANTPKFTDEDVVQFAEKLQSLATNQNSDSIQDKYISPMELYRGNVVEEEEDIVEVSSKKNPRMKWTRELCEEFLRDSESMNLEDIMSKWNIEKKSRYYSMKHYAKSVVNNSSN